MARSKKGKEAARVVLMGLAWAGVICIAWQSPYFLHRVIPKILKYAKWKIKSRRKEICFRNSFYYLRRQGYIEVKKDGRQIYIYLTKEGKEKVKRYNFDNLEIKKPKKWDGRWRILIFDISDKHKIKREALRGKLKELGFYQLQKSVWMMPYDFKKEAAILQNFFNFAKGEMRVIESATINEDTDIKRHFNLV
jgi:CRISPR-associated endonuclease Cas2